MKKLTILIDMDDTIENLCETWVEYLNEVQNTNVSIEDIKEWDMTKAFPTLTKSEIFEPLNTVELWHRVKPLPHAVEVIKKLVSDGHKVVIVTASHPETIQLKLDNVLFKYFPFLTYKDVIVASQKQLIQGDILIDDAPHNLEGRKFGKFLFEAPHNKSYDAKKANMIRVNDWRKIYQYIHFLSLVIDRLENI